MKIAVFTNFLDNIGGAEIATLILARGLDADVYTTNINAEMIKKMGFEDVLPRIFSIGRVPIHPPFRQQATFYLFRKLDLKGKYSHHVISGDWAMSGAVNNHPNIWYAYSPLNEIWEFKDWVRENLLSPWKRPLYDIFVWFNRMLTLRYAKSVDVFTADAINVQKRLKKYYNVDSAVIYPPTDTSKYYNLPSKNYWLSVNRLIKHKRIEIQVEAFAKLPDEKLVIVGSYEKGTKQSEEYKKHLESIMPSNVEIMNWVSNEKLLELYAKSKGLIATAMDEDFGMSPVEAMASGKPVIAPNTGGYKETVVSGKTGLLLENINNDKLVYAISRISGELKQTPDKYKDECTNQAKKFDVGVFISNFRNIMLNIGVQCPCCGFVGNEFLPYGIKVRMNAKCPKCSALERHRTQYLYLKSKLTSKDKIKVLHIAPEKPIGDLFKSYDNVDYLSIDLDGKRAMKSENLLNLSFLDSTFDVIFCSHVLEHILDDRKAMREIHRVLRPGGFAILQVPMYDIDRTYEDEKIVTPEERLRAFGQDDHVRMYGRDYVDRLRESGFQVSVINHSSEYSEEMKKRYSLSRDPIYVCTKQ